MRNHISLGIGAVCGALFTATVLTAIHMDRSEREQVEYRQESDHYKKCFDAWATSSTFAKMSGLEREGWGQGAIMFYLGAGLAHDPDRRLFDEQTPRMPIPDAVELIGGECAIDRDRLLNE